MNTFSISEAMLFGWRAFKARPAFYVLLSLLLIVVPAAVGHVGRSGGGVSGEALGSLVSGALSLILTIGIYTIFLKVERGEPADSRDLFTKLHLILPFFFASVLSSVLILIGFVCLVLPGIYLSLRLWMVPLLVLDQGKGPVEAIKASWALTRGSVWSLFLFSLALIGINLLGIAALLVGLLVSIPVSFLAVVRVYRFLASAKASEGV